MVFARSRSFNKSLSVEEISPLKGNRDPLKGRLAPEMVVVVEVVFVFGVDCVGCVLLMCIIVICMRHEHVLCVMYVLCVCSICVLTTQYTCMYCVCIGEGV